MTELNLERPFLHRFRAAPVALRQHAVGLAVTFLLLSYAGVFWISRNSVFGDESHYLRLADSLLRGQFTGEFPGDVPLTDKVRNLGYPAFLAGFKLVHLGLMAVKVAQLLCTLATVAILVDLLKKLARINELPERTTVAVFLVICALNVQFPYYAANISSESTMALATAAFLGCLYREPTLRAGATAGLAAGIGFMLRPTILYFPFLVFVVRVRDRRWRLPMLAMMAAYSVFLVGSGLFNLGTNGVFSIGPIEGSANYPFIGFWQHKMPDASTHRHWGVSMGHEHLEHPSPAEVARAAAGYDADWDAIDRITRNTLTEEDRAFILKRGGDVNRPSIWGANYGPAYHAAKNQALRDITLRHIAAEPGYWVRTRIYNAFRLFFPNIDPTKWAESGRAARLQAVWATSSAFVTFIIGLGLVAVLLGRRKLDRASAALTGALVLYFWAVHIPLNLAARYTIPIQLPAIVLVALAVARLVRPAKDATQSARV